MCTPDQHQLLTDRLDGLQAEVAALKTEVALLRAWADSWPAERERGAISALMKAEIDLYRKTAEVALTTLAERIHDEIGTLQSGMTEGAETAIASLASEVRGFAASVDTSVDWSTRLTLLRGLVEKQNSFNDKVEHLIAANERWWSEERQEREAKAASEAREKHRRMERARRRIERKRRRDKMVGGIVTPLLLMVFGGFNAYLFNRAAALPPASTLLMLAGVVAVAGGFSYYWLVWRTPPDEQDIEERGGDQPPPAAPGPPGDDTQAAGG